MPRDDDHLENETNATDEHEFMGAVRGPDVKEAIARDPEKATKLANALAQWAKGGK